MNARDQVLEAVVEHVVRRVVREELAAQRAPCRGAHDHGDVRTALELHAGTLGPGARFLFGGSW